MRQVRGLLQKILAPSTVSSLRRRPDRTVSNPDALKGHEGHQVTVSANVYADKNEINVVSVEMGKKDSMQ